MKTDLAGMKLLSIAIVWALAPLSAQARTWTGTDGRTLEAEFVETKDDKVTLRRKSDGRRFTIPLAKLSQTDREWVAEKSSGPVPKPPGGIFEGGLTGKWEKMEFMRMKFRFFGGTGLDPKERYPLVLYLHSAGLVGSDNEKQLGSAPRKFAEKDVYTKHPSFVLVPQCPNDGTREKATHAWEERKHRSLAIKLVREAIARLPVDEERIYVVGVSNGAIGTFELVQSERELFAGAITVGTGAGKMSDPSRARSMKNTAFWVHTTVGGGPYIEACRKMAAALERVGAKVQFTEHPRGSGASGGAAQCFEDPALYEWLFAQRREASKR